MVMFKKLQATDSCSCAVTGATAVVGTVIGALANGKLVTTLVGTMIGALVTGALVPTLVGSADGESVDTEGDTDGVSVTVTFGGLTTGAIVPVVLVVGGGDIGVDVAFGTEDVVGAPLLGDVVSSLPLQFPVPQ